MEQQAVLALVVLILLLTVLPGVIGSAVRSSRERKIMEAELRRTEELHKN